MCSIHGFYRPEATQGEAAMGLVSALIMNGEKRGRDSWGVVAGTEKASVRKVGPPTNVELPMSWGLMPWAVATCRAEPTTEHVRNKTEQDIPPFTEHGVTVAHNGTIANDAELARLWDCRLPTRIDSRVLPGLVSHSVDDDSIAMKLTELVKGSFAMAAGVGKRLVLATNFKPLYLRTMPNGVTYFTSCPPLGWRGWEAMEPYTMKVFEPNGGVVTYSLRPIVGDSRSLVVCSGGMDSTVAAALEKDAGRNVELLHFRYGCRAERAEGRAVQAVADALGAPLRVVELDTLFTQVIGHSPLTGTGEHAAGEAGAEYAHEWVPGRNLVMLSIATAIAEAYGIKRVVLGNNLEEAGAYPDNEPAFIDRLNDVMPYAVGHNREVNITMPVGNLMKHEIVRLGVDVGAPLDVTWSCYEDGDVHCGDCGPCFMRKVAHEMQGLPDGVEYRR